MAERRDFYEVLGVDRGADKETIRKAYRQLARQHHPDLHPGDSAAADRFKEISEAYSVLSDPERRRNYDEFGELSLQSGFDPEEARRARDAFKSSFHGQRGSGGPGGEGFAFGDIDDLLGDLFGAARPGARPRPRRGADLEAELELDFLDAARGCQKTFTVSRPRADGSLRQESVTVRIPPGVRSGGRIRLPGKGAESPSGGPPGDLHARVRVRPHPVFRAEGHDLQIDLPVSVREAVHGAQIEIPTLEGRATVTVPPGTSSGTRLRLRGKGIAKPGSGGRGDLYATLQIHVPAPGASTPDADTLSALDPSDLRAKLFA